MSGENKKPARLHEHKELIERAKRALPDEGMICDLANLFKLFGDSTRARILYALSGSEMCVCAIAELLSMTQSAISHQLRILKDGDLIGNRREGKTIYYFLADDHVRTILEMGFEHLTEEK